MIKEKSCGAVVYTAVDGEIKYLLVQMMGGHYSFPKGHVESGESEEQTALREIKEETDLDVSLDTAFRQSVVYSPYVGCEKEVVYFVAYAKSRETVCQQTEIRRALWLSYDDAIEHVTFDNDKRILNEANEYLKKTLQ
ncbi:MAG: NUDIX domain-containing protein [Clostridia bacterium]|nr:NUDIX domain-containing protein [Clostridia bacterium]